MHDYEVPQGLYYSQEHQWVRIDGDLAVVGLTDYAQSQLGDVSYVDLPEPGCGLSQMDEMGAVESAKVVADVLSPLAGVVAQINEALEDEPDLVNSDCYGSGWLIKLKNFDADGLGNLLDAGAYQDLLSSTE